MIYIYKFIKNKKYFFIPLQLFKLLIKILRCKTNLKKLLIFLIITFFNCINN